MFDANAYRKDVLKPLLDGGRRTSEDAFMVFALDPATDDVSAIQARIDEVVAFWRKEQSSPRYKGLVTALLKERDELAGQLLDPALRAANRERVMAGRASDAEARFARLDEMLDTLDRRLGGIPASRLDRLRATSRRLGVTDAEFDARVGRRRLIDDGPSGSAAPPPPAVRQQARSLLAEHARLGEQGGASGVHRTLFDFLGVSPTAPVDAIRSAQETLAARNRQRRHDRVRTVVDELLALSTDLLVTGDRAGYVAGLAEDVADLLRPQIETAVLVEDRLTPVEFERLLRAAISEGLEAPAARSLLLRLAQELGAPIETGAVVDYVVCASCAAAQPADAARCARCGAELFRSCPRCGRRSPRSAARCEGCELDLRALAEAETDLAAVAHSLDDGYVADARWRLESLEPWAGSLPQVAELRRRADTAHREALERWDDLMRLVAQARFDDAAHAVAELEQRAKDVPGPDGAGLDSVRPQIEAALADTRDRLAGALAHDGPARESAVLALADELPHSVAVLGALRSLPVAAPSRARAVLGDNTVTVGWKASPAHGPVSYRVFRTVHDESGGEVRSVGSTGSTTIEDAGAPPGRLVSYEVQAVRHGIASGRAGTQPLLTAFDVDRLTVVEHDGAIELRWARLAGDHSIWAERADLTDPSAPTRRMRSGESGIMDTNVVTGHRYRYKVAVEYRSAGTFVMTTGREVTATAFRVPDPPVLAEVVTRDHAITLTLAPPGEGTVLRCGDDPALAAGTVVERRRLEGLGRALTTSDGTATDGADGGFRWYLPVAAFGAQAVTGPAVAHPGLDDVADVHAAAEGGAIVLRWAWPPGCTECHVTWKAEEPPAPAGPTTAKVTNTAYQLADGWRLEGAPLGTLHFLVRPLGRAGNTLVAVPGGPEWARTAHESVSDAGRVYYRVRRAGRRKRGAEVEVVGGSSLRPDLVVVARAGSEPPRSAEDGRVLGTIARGATSIDLDLEDVALPIVIGLFPGDGAPAKVRIEDPALDDRTVR